MMLLVFFCIYKFLLWKSNRCKTAKSLRELFTVVIPAEETSRKIIFGQILKEMLDTIM